MTRIQISSALFLAVCGALLVGWTPASCFAQPGPRLQSVTPRGLQVGQTTEVTVRGSQLGPSASLLFPFPAEIERTDDGQQGNLATFHVNVPAETPAGYYALRVRSAAGISAPQYVAVGGVPNTSAKEESVLQLPAAITGDIQGDNISHTKFVGQAGESITVEVEAQRLGSKLRPVIELLRPDGNILAVAHGVPQWQGDCRLRVELPVDGT